jgi:hypothetical protein
MQGCLLQKKSGREKDSRLPEQVWVVLEASSGCGEQTPPQRLRRYGFPLHPNDASKSSARKQNPSGEAIFR